LPEPDGARESRARRVHARPRTARGQPRARVRHLPAAEGARGAEGRHHERRRAADAGHRPGADGRAAAVDPRRAVVGPESAAGRAAVRADPAPARRRTRGAAGRAERRPVARDRRSRLRAGDRRAALPGAARRAAGQRRTEEGLSGTVTMQAPVTPPQTLAQKLVARAAGRERLAQGEIVNCRVDLAMFHDSSGPRRLAPMLAELGAQLWDRNKVVLVIDHFVPEADDESHRIVRLARDWAAAQRLPHVYDSVGICHVVVPQHGHIRPGMFCVGGDSHSPTGGAFGAYMFGIGATEMLGVAVTGEIWLRVPHTIAMEWTGRLAPGVSAKDMMLDMCTRFGMDGGRYEAIEYRGSAVEALSMNERMTLSNMTAELGGQAGLIAPDATTIAWLQGGGVAPAELAGWQQWHGDEDAVFHERHVMDASALAPQVSAPGSPAQARPAQTFGDERLDIAYI